MQAAQAPRLALARPPSRPARHRVSASAQPASRREALLAAGAGLLVRAPGRPTAGLPGCGSKTERCCQCH